MKGEGQAEHALRWSEEKLSMNGSQLVAASNANEVLLLSHVIVFESRPALLSFRCLDTCVCVCSGQSEPNHSKCFTTCN